MVKISMLMVVLGICGISSLNFSQQDDEKKYETNTSKFMAKKLDNARGIVEGLALEDFDMIGKAAQDLTLLSHESDWNVIQSERYLQLSTDFRRSTGRLQKAADEDSLDGSTLAYIEVTLNCVRCHQYLRDNHSGK